MSCVNCGSAFHEVWACPKPRKESTAARKDVPIKLGPKALAEKAEVTRAHASAAGTQAPPVDTLIVGKRRGRPQTITDMKAYKAQKAKEYRLKAKREQK